MKFVIGLFILADDSARMIQLVVLVLLAIACLSILYLSINLRKYHKVEKKLRANEEQLQFVIAGSRDAYWDWRLDTNQDTISPRFFEMLGYAPGEIPSSFENWQNLIHPDDRADIDAALKKHLDGKTDFYAHEHRFLTKTGEWRWILGRGKVVEWDKDGKPLRMTGVYTDVNERYNFEQTTRMLLQVTSFVRGGDFFNRLLLELVKALNMRYAYIGQLVEPDRDRIRIVSACLDGEISEGLEYSLDEVPCRDVAAGKVTIYTDDVQQLFPRDARLAAVGARSFIGIPLNIQEGKLLGVMVVMNDHPLGNQELAVKLLTIFAGRAAVELERMQVEKALLDSEQRWKFALERTGDGVWDWNLHTNQVSFSRSFKLMLGYRDEEFEDRIEAWMIRIHPEDSTYVISEYERHLRGEIDSFDAEYRIKCKDGYYKWILGRGKVIQRGEDGSPLRLVGTQTDITFRKASEQVLHDTMSKYQSLFSTMSEGFAFYQLLLDENNHPYDYILLDVNPAFSTLFHIPRERIIGSRGSQLFQGERPFCLEEFARVALSGQAEHLEVFFDQIERYLSITIFSPEKGRFAAVYGDITGRKQTETALANERNLLRTLIDNLPDAIYVKDINFRKTLANKADLMNCGVSSEAEVLGKSDFDIWPRELATHFNEHDRYVIEKGLPLFKQEELISAVGKPPRWLMTAKIPLRDVNGTVIGLVGIGHEISESKLAIQEINRLNAELEQRVDERTSQLAAVVKELEAFSYSVSHDLRSPLRSMEGFSSALLEDYGSQVDEIGRDYLIRIKSAAQRMSQLIDDMLKLSRITRSDLHRSEINLSDLASSVAAEIQSGAPDRKVVWVVRPLMTINGDPNMLRIVLVNLLGNAWKFTSRHETAHIEVNMMEKEGRPVYYVRDDGAGFDMAYATKLFGPFQRMHGASEFEGSGIGLATVQRVVMRHGGKVWAESQVENGTTIYFSLG